jgi:glycosyltransferase involved in cell wall biosynthesis
MKILFVCENYIPHLGGVEVVIKNLAENYVKLGHKVTILTHRIENTPLEEIIGGVKVIRVHSFGSRYLFTFSAIFKAIKLAKENDIIQTTTFNGAPPAWLAAKLTGKKVAITVHEVWVNKWQKVTGFSRFKSLVHDLLERAIYLLPYDKYLCVSNATKRDLLKLKIKPVKVLTIYNGFDYEFWDPNKAISEKNDDFTFYSFGRAGPSKGFKYLIAAIPKICEILPSAKFVLMFSHGKANEERRKNLISKIKNLGLPRNVKLLEPISYEKNRDQVKLADCVIIPSTAEGFGYAALEAVAMSIPVLVSNAGSLPEVVSGKHLIFESQNVQDLVDKAVEMAKGKFNETEFKKFEWDECVSKYLEVYKELV